MGRKVKERRFWERCGVLRGAGLLNCAELDKIANRSAGRAK